MGLVTPTRIQSPAPLLALLSHNHHQRIRIPFFSITVNPKPTPTPTPTSTFPRLRTQAKTRRWDSNAETFRTHKFDFHSMDDDDDDDDTDQWLDILEDFIDGVWIFKAFRSFGWMLPAIISSLLLTSGPKAFLMALAIPLGQSALSSAFQMVWGRPNNKTRPPPRGRRQSRPRRTTATYGDTGNEERKRAGGYETWAAGDDDDKKSSTFGGWEEPDQSNNTRLNGKGKTSRSDLSRRERRSETPLLLRLLIAVFPFLGSWTRMI